MRRLFSFLMASAFVFAISCESGPTGPNQLSKKEKKEGWVLLFDGETSTGWRGNNRPDFPSGWEVVEGTLHCKGSGAGEAGAQDGGDILYDKEFTNFRLKMEWKIS